jgi:hypothetical protein
MSENKTASATLNVTCDVQCPYCEDVMDLFDEVSLTDDGYIYKELMPPDDYWGKEDWGEIVQCVNCGEMFTVIEVMW